MNKLIEFDPANYLDSEEVIAEYLRLAQRSDDGELLISAQSDVARAEKIFKQGQLSKPNTAQ
jgi:DNA-binding phage protein